MNDGGGGQQTKYDWNDTMAQYWGGNADYPGGVLAQALQESRKPYQVYQGERIAGLDPRQQEAQQIIANTAWNGSALGNAGRQQSLATMQGDYLNGPNRNPWAEAYSQAGRNQYEGDSPYFRDMMRSGMDDITNSYLKGTAANTRAAFNRAGAFGGSAYNQAVADNEAGLGRNLSRYANEMANQQYDRSANLQEGYLGRDLQNQQFNLGRGTNAWEAERNRQMGALPGAMAGDEATYRAGGALMGLGDANRQLAQERLNLGYQDWQGGQNWGRNQLDFLTGMLSRAQGGVSPNSSTTMGGYQASPFSQFLGAGLAARGMFG